MWNKKSEMADFKEELKNPLFVEAVKAMSRVFHQIINEAIDNIHSDNSKKNEKENNHGK